MTENEKYNKQDLVENQTNKKCEPTEFVGIGTAIGDTVGLKLLSIMGDTPTSQTNPYI